MVVKQVSLIYHEITNRRKENGMGTYVNRGNQKFIEALNSACYIDKSGLIGFMNAKLYTNEKETSFTRSRRFGKTTACNMLTAYYSVECDSAELFKGLEIEQDPSYRKHLNKHPVICFDLFSFMRKWNSGKLKDRMMVQYLESTLVEEMAEEYPGAAFSHPCFCQRPCLPWLSFP